MTDVAYRSMMSSSDAIIWHLESDPKLRSTVMSVWLLDSEPTPARMRASIAHMVAVIPRLRQRVEPGRPRPHWVDVPADDLDLDLHYTEFTVPGGDIDDVSSIAEQWVREPFDRSRPLWHFGLVRGLADGRAGAIIKVHHSIADGMGMVLMLGAFLDLEADPPPRPSPVADADVVDDRVVFTHTRRMAHRIRSAASGFMRAPVATWVDAARSISSTIRLVTPHRTPHSRVMTDRSGTFQLDMRRVPLDDLKAASKSTGVSINDVYVAVVVDALDRYHAAQGSSCERLRLHMPVDARTERTAHLAGNEFVPARLSLDVEPGCSADRLQSTSRQLALLRAEPSLGHINPVSALIQRLGRPTAVWIVAGMMKGVDVLPSNVPGPPFPLYLAGARIDHLYAFGPPAGAALNITLFSYDGNANFGITTDDAAICDRDAFLDCFDEALAEIATLVPV